MSSGSAAVLSHHLTSQSVLYQTILDSPSLTCCMHVYTIIFPPSTTTHSPSTAISPLPLPPLTLHLLQFPHSLYHHSLFIYCNFHTPSTATHSPSTAISPLPLPPLTLHLLQFPHSLYHHSLSIYCNFPTPSTTTHPPSTAISPLPLPPLTLHLLQFSRSLYHHSPSIYCNFPTPSTTTHPPSTAISNAIINHMFHRKQAHHVQRKTQTNYHTNRIMLKYKAY